MFVWAWVCFWAGWEDYSLVVQTIYDDLLPIFGLFWANDF